MARVGVVLAGFLTLGATTHATAPLIQYPTASAAEARPPEDCARYFHDLCSHWRIAEWLPVLPAGFEPWRRNKARTVNFTDAFIYEGKVPAYKDWGTSQGYPADGTAFVYGTAGPPKGTVVYDYVDAIAFYSQGCCSWHTTVLAAGATAPPIPVVKRNLRKVHTVHGIALGDSLERVEAVYGAADPQSIPGQFAMTLLSYVHMTSQQCGQFQNFAFLHDRLVYIELLNGC